VIPLNTSASSAALRDSLEARRQKGCQVPFSEISKHLLGSSKTVPDTFFGCDHGITQQAAYQRTRSGWMRKENMSRRAAEFAVIPLNNSANSAALRDTLKSRHQKGVWHPFAHPVKAKTL